MLKMALYSGSGLVVTVTVSPIMAVVLSTLMLPCSVLAMLTEYWMAVNTALTVTLPLGIVNEFSTIAMGLPYESLTLSEVSL